MERFDIITATFRPQRIDDLKPGVSTWIGRTLKWQAGWLVDKQDGGPYVGLWAMTPMTDELVPFGWVPLCDLEIEMLDR